MRDAYPEQYLEGLRLFNRREFFECHDALEELWSETVGPEKKFLQGLIQAAVALFHFGETNYGGAKRQYFYALANLQPYVPRYWGLDLERFLSDFQSCFQELLECTDAYPVAIALCDERIPRLTVAGESCEP